MATRVGRPYFEFAELNDTSLPPYPRGYAVDLVEAIFKIINKENNLNWEPEFYQVEGNKYGNPAAGSKKWDGLIGDLMDHVSFILRLSLTSRMAN